jgi:hypothetical protein
MVHVASNASKLQLTSLVMHEEVFCNVGPINSRKRFSYFRGIRCVHGALCGRDSSIVVRDLSVRHYKGAGAANIHLVGSLDVDNSRFSRLCDGGRVLSPRVCRMHLVWS